MPKKKKFNPAWIFGPLIILLIIAAIIFFFVGLSKGWFGIGQQFTNIELTELFGREPDAECTFVVDDETVCLWDNVTGIINANSPNCYIGYNYNNEGWRFAGVIDEVSPGFYQESRQTTVVGNYLFAAICGIPSDFCRTNDVEVDVIDCDEPAPIEYTCGWVGDQCGGTCPDTHPLCVDMWYDVLFGGYSFCACINPDDETVHPDWKPDGQYHDPFDEEMNGEPNGEWSPVGEICGGDEDYICSGDCPGTYSCDDFNFFDEMTGIYYDQCACMSDGLVHDDWIDGGIYHDKYTQSEVDDILAFCQDQAIILGYEGGVSNLQYPPGTTSCQYYPFDVDLCPAPAGTSSFRWEGGFDSYPDWGCCLWIC